MTPAEYELTQQADGADKKSLSVYQDDMRMALIFPFTAIEAFVGFASEGWSVGHALALLLDVPMVDSAQRGA